MANKRRVTVHVDAELIAAVRAVIGPEGFVAPAVAEAVQLWLASKRAGNATHEPVPAEPPALPWNAYRLPSTTRA